MKNKDLKLIPLELEKSITKKTKWIILNSPSNPTGACYSEKILKKLQSFNKTSSCSYFK